jgi:hypothetical protein
MQQTLLGKFKPQKEEKLIEEKPETKKQKIFLPWVEK